MEMKNKSVWEELVRGVEPGDTFALEIEGEWHQVKFDRWMEFTMCSFTTLDKKEDGLYRGFVFNAFPTNIIRLGQIK